MKAVYRERTITEQMDYILEGDKPIAYFLLNQREYDQFIKEGTFTFSDSASTDKTERFLSYKGIKVIVE